MLGTYNLLIEYLYTSSISKMKFLAVRCFSCRAMQVKQSNKSKKWSCSICHEKQSLRKVFFSSDAGIDVRGFVQQANLVRGLSEEAFANGSFLVGGKENSIDCQNAVLKIPNNKQPTEPNKWERFLSKEDFADDGGGDPADDKYTTFVSVRKPRNPPCRIVSSTEEPPKHGGRSGQKRSASVTAETKELKERGLQSAYPRPKYSGVTHDTESELSLEKSTFSPPSNFVSDAANCECAERTSKKGYSILVGETSHEESKASKRKELQYQSSKWGKYLELDDS